MKKIAIMILCAAGLAATVNAQDNKKATLEVPQWVKNIKVSGYGMMQYQAEDADGKEHNEFNLRLMRLIMDGRIGDFDWRVQGQATSNAGPGNPTFSLVDLFAEWNKYKEVRIKVGQFKRAFTFENPMNPINEGWYAYALAVNNLAGFGDRTGEKSSGGRDIGLQVQGDLLPNSQGRRLLHYQVGIYNGEGINQKDLDNRKDIIGGLWVAPIEGVRLGVFGWTGSRSAIGAKNRYALSAEYDKDQYTFRAEYIHSQGWGANRAYGTKADGWYAMGIMPVIQSKLHAKARYNVYRATKMWNGKYDENGQLVGGAKTMYEVGVNYFFTPKLQLNAEYAFVNDRSQAKHNYNFFDVQLDFRF